MDTSAGPLNSSFFVIPTPLVQPWSIWSPQLAPMIG